MNLSAKEKRLIASVGTVSRRYWRKQFEEGTCTSAVLALYKEWQLSRIEKPAPIPAPVVPEKRPGKIMEIDIDIPENIPEFLKWQITKFMRENGISNMQAAAGTGLSKRTVQRVKAGESSFRSFSDVLYYLHREGMRGIDIRRIICEE